MQIQVTEKDREAVKRLRDHYIRGADGWTTDESFTAWFAEVLKSIRIEEYQRVKRVMENDPAFDKNKIWCDRCQDYIAKSELKRWTGDDALHYLCPGCDSDLLPVQILEE